MAFLMLSMTGKAKSLIVVGMAPSTFVVAKFLEALGVTGVAVSGVSGSTCTRGPDFPP